MNKKRKQLDNAVMINDAIAEQIIPLFSGLGWGKITHLTASASGILLIRWDVSPSLSAVAALSANAAGDGPAYVLDPDTGALCRQLVLMPAIWMNVERLRAWIINGAAVENKEQIDDALGIDLEHGRLRLYRGTNWWYFGYRVWPMLHNPGVVSPSMQEQLARLLLLRSGASNGIFFQANPSSSNTFAGLERCAVIGRIETKNLQLQIRNLTQDALEDHRILELFLRHETNTLVWEVLAANALQVSPAQNKTRKTMVT